MKVHWATKIEGVANQFGFSVHDKKSREALALEGVELTEDCGVSIYVTTPLMFDPPDDGRFHVAFTAWDSTKLPEGAACMAKADAVICTSSYMVPVLKTVCRPGTPFFVCPLGVDVASFARRRPRRIGRLDRMKILWVGAPNHRKGYQHALAAMEAMAKAGVDFHWYFKTTTPDESKRDVVTQTISKGLVTFDSRRLPWDDLIKLYHDAHVFLFPTLGEGFGLTLAEAMASGLPCVYTPWSGHTDYCDETVAFPLKYEVCTEKSMPNLPEDHPMYDKFVFDGTFANPDIRDICDQLLWVREHYKAAEHRGRKAAIRMRRYTWKNTGRVLKAILEEIGDHSWQPA